MNWSFATINGKMGEIYFDKNKNGRIKISGHCYVKESEFTIAEELQMLKEDVQKVRVVYRDNKYKINYV